MSTHPTETLELDLSRSISADVCVGEVVWPKFLESGHADRQLQQLTSLCSSARTGMILDCTFVEIGNSEILSFLMRVRNHARKMNKEVALFNVPPTLQETLRLCKLNSVLRSADDATAAKRLVADLAGGKGSARIWLESHLILVVFLVICLCIMLGLAGYLIAG